MYDQEEEENIPQPTNFQSSFGNTRVLDNHYDPKVHEKPWVAPGHLRDYKYEYSDSGLGFVMNKQKKMQAFKERHEQIKEVEELNRKSRGFRHFREYDNVCNNEIIITIEYCTNCKQHQGSTRHDEEKYAYFANTLKKAIITQYPVVKVILKPLIFSLNDESTENIYLRSRIGAFEVQLFSKNNKGEITRRYIYSKLRTRNWPNVGAVVESVSSFLPTDDFVVRLIDPNYDPEEIKEESEHSSHTSSQRKLQTSKLKGLFVVIRPFRSNKSNTLGSPEFSSNQRGLKESTGFSMSGTSRPTSGVKRPQSAYSVASNKSTLSNKKSPTLPQGQGQGQEGQEKSPVIPREYVEQTDNFGIVNFKQVPHNIYEIEVLENHNYLPEKRIVNVFELLERGDQLREDIVLKEQTMGFCLVKLLENKIPVGDATIIVAKKHPDANSKTAVLREKEPKSGIYEFMIDPGEYIISISKPGFGEKKEEIQATRGVNEFTIDLADHPGYVSEHPPQQHQQQQQQLQPQSQPQSHAPQQHRSPEHQQQQPQKTEERPNSRQRPPSSKGRHEPQGLSASKPGGQKGLEVIQQENMESSPTKKPQEQQKHPEKAKEHETGHEEAKKERVKSAMVKKVEFFVADIDTGKPVAGAAVMLEEIGFKGTTNEHGKCLVPINKLNNGKLILDHSEYFGMVEEYGDDGIDLKNAPEKKFSLIPRPTDIHEVQLRFLPGNGHQCAKFRLLFNQEDEESKKDIVVKHAEGGKELITMKNLFKKHGVFRVVAEVSNLEEFFHPESMFILSHYSDCDQLYIFPPNEKLLEANRLIWDVGFFADPIANPQFVEINGYSNTDITLYSFLKEYQMILNYLHNSKTDLKTLLGFKEKGKVEKDGDILIPRQAIYTSLDKYGLEIKNVDHLLSSACTPEGLYSFRECERRFASLKPPFNFVKDQKKNNLSADSEGEEGEEEEEYLFEDEH